MDLQRPAQYYTTTLCDRYQSQRLSFVFIPTRCLKENQIPPSEAVSLLLEPNAGFRKEVSASYLLAALASLLKAEITPSPNPFDWVDKMVPGAPIEYILPFSDPNAISFAEHVAYSEIIPFEESPLKGKSAISAAAYIGAKIGLIVGGAGTPLVFITVPAGIVVCTAAVTIGPELGKKLLQLMGLSGK